VQQNFSDPVALLAFFFVIITLATTYAASCAHASVRGFFWGVGGGVFAFLHDVLEVGGLDIFMCNTFEFVLPCANVFAFVFFVFCALYGNAVRFFFRTDARPVL
jgi:hypothetical protein